MECGNLACMGIGRSKVTADSDTQLLCNVIVNTHHFPSQVVCTRRSPKPGFCAAETTECLPESQSSTRNQLQQSICLTKHKVAIILSLKYFLRGRQKVPTHCCQSCIHIIIQIGAEKQDILHFTVLSLVFNILRLFFFILNCQHSINNFVILKLLIKSCSCLEK